MLCLSPIGDNTPQSPHGKDNEIRLKIMKYASKVLFTACSGRHWQTYGHVAFGEALVCPWKYSIKYKC